MPAVLTEASTLRCQHQGTVKPRVVPRGLMVDDSPVLVDEDLPLAPIDGCPETPPCRQVAKVSDGVSTRLKAGGRPVLLATAQGTTNTGSRWQVSDPVQTKLEAA